MAKDTGGAAFPSEFIVGKDYAGIDVIKREKGMTLRDYFAAKMLPSLVSTQWPLSVLGIKLQDGLSDLEQYASAAYAFADAMLAERSKP